MSIPKLTIVPAGAGSGKTFKIKSDLYEWIDRGWVKPEKVVAVTFTEAAAGELRERISSQLIARGKLEEALKLDQAYISTIHGFGLRILTEFAFEAGGSPRARLLNEDEQEILLRRALSKTSEDEEITRNLSAYGYHYQFVTGQGEEDSFRSRILELINKLKDIGQSGLGDDLTGHACEEIVRIYGPTRAADHLNSLLQTAVQRLLSRFPEDLSPLVEGNKSATESLQKDFKNLCRADRAEPLEHDWGLWQQLTALRLSKRGAALPDGYEELALAVMAAAGNLPEHPGPLKQALDHVQALLRTAQDCLGSYALEKHQRGLLDYQDMLALAHDLLLNNRIVREALVERVGCLIIDEFQDTNPLQFALLWMMQQAGLPTLVVGDLKQAIMGFQGADPRLMEQLARQSPGDCQPQLFNWRSQQPLMAWINQVGAGLFGEDYTHLEPKADYDSHQKALDVLRMPDKPYRGSTAIPAQYMALHLQSLLNDPEQIIFDRHKGRHRRLKGGDIAIIAPTHKRLERYAEALRFLGIPNRIAGEGWFESSAVQIAFHALSLVADANDRHAQLYLAVTELGSHTLESALKELFEERDLNDPLVQRLLPLNDQADILPVDELVQQTLAATDLYAQVSLWPDADQARANLLRLQEEASEFLHANRDALATANYFGSGLKTFITWLRNRAERDNKQPAPRVHDENAVELATWHSSKGREWPVVVVGGLDAEVKHFLPHTRVIYEDFANLGSILDEARMEIFPDFASDVTKERFLSEFRDEIEQGARRVLYVALTRAREKVVLEWPEHQAGDNLKSYWQMLTAWTGMTLDQGRLLINATEHPCHVVTCHKQSPSIFCDQPAGGLQALSGFGLRALVPGDYCGPCTPEATSPSALKNASAEITGISGITSFNYAGPLATTFDMADNERGTLLHRCYEVLPHCPDTASLKAACDFEFSQEQEQAVRVQVTAFNHWLGHNFAPIDLGFEVPFLLQNEVGSVISGIIDLVVETAQGFWIIDHKSDQVEDRPARFAEYLPQLQAYAEALCRTRPDKPVLGIGINWVTPGEVMLQVESRLKIFLA